MRAKIYQAMHSPDDWVVKVDYRDKKGNTTHRVISPIRFVAKDRLLALCLCREQPRQFQLDRCSNVELEAAANVLMPVPLVAGALRS